MIQKILLSNLLSKGLIKKIKLEESSEMNLDEVIEKNEQPKKRGFLKD